MTVTLGAGFTASAIAVGEFHACALSTQGAVRCWGRNDYGQLGHNMPSVMESATPVTPVGLTTGVRAIGAGRYHSCAALTAGGARCWGGNLYGELGNGAMGTGERSPVVVSNLTGLTAVSISGGDSSTCLATTTGTMRCWGRGYDGQLGNGSMGFNTDTATPVTVSGVTSGATQVTCGYGFACAVVSGGARCWGSNFYLVLGNNSGASTVQTTPGPVTNLTSGVTAISGSASDHVCALTTAGAVKCWGEAGPHLGTGDDQTSAPIPVGVVGLP